MKLNHLTIFADAIEKIHLITGIDIPDIVDALTDTVFDEEDASQIKAYHAEEPIY